MNSLGWVLNYHMTHCPDKRRLGDKHKGKTKKSHQQEIANYKLGIRLQNKVNPVRTSILDLQPPQGIRQSSFRCLSYSL